MAETENEPQDESLVRYKQQLPGSVPAASDDSDPRNVVVEKMVFRSEGRDDIVLDLTGDLSTFKDNPITIKEGCEYKIQIIFKVKRESVSGLRLFQSTYRKGVWLDKGSIMVGSFGPKVESQSYTTRGEEAPKGMINWGHYTMKSKLTDDDKNDYLTWEWTFDIKKEWD